jgi:hypothetical protein
VTPVPLYLFSSKHRISPKTRFGFDGGGIQTGEGQALETVKGEDSVIDHGVDGKNVGGGFCEHGNEYCVWRKVGQFIPWLIGLKLTRKTVQ